MSVSRKIQPLLLSEYTGTENTLKFAKTMFILWLYDYHFKITDVLWNKLCLCLLVNFAFASSFFHFPFPLFETEFLISVSENLRLSTMERFLYPYC